MKNISMSITVSSNAEVYSDELCDLVGNYLHSIMPNTDYIGITIVDLDKSNIVTAEK